MAVHPDVRKAVTAVPALLSGSVADVVAAVEKLRVDDRLIAAPEQLVSDLEAMFDAVTLLQAVPVRRLRDVFHAEATEQLA